MERMLNEDVNDRLISNREVSWRSCSSSFGAPFVDFFFVMTISTTHKERTQKTT
jgi:hypothetical protein